MIAPSNDLSIPQRRRALRWAIVNGALWSIGNALTTGVLIIYLMRQMGARGLDVAAILALQSLVGLLRLAAPPLIVGLGGVKSTAISLSILSYLLLVGLPLVLLDAVPLEHRVTAFIILICIHQLLEHLASVAIWTWLAELVPTRLRGRYFATRQKWQLIVQIPAVLVAGVFANYWREGAKDSASVEYIMLGYMIPIGVGALVLLISLWPLVRMPAVTWRPPPVRRLRDRAILAPLLDGRFGRLLLYGCWFSFFNGLAQSATTLYPIQVLKLDVMTLMLLPVGMRLGQIALVPSLGRFSDRYGNRPTMLLCQAVLAFAPLCFFMATREQPWWIAGAFVLYSAYVGLNICLPNLTLKLAHDSNYAGYTATYFALTGVAYGVSTLAGGWILDLFDLDTFYVNNRGLDIFGYLFYIAMVTRLLAVILIHGIDEPGAWSWPAILRSLTVGRRSPTELG